MRERLGESVGIVVAVMFFLVGFTNFAIAWLKNDRYRCSFTAFLYGRDVNGASNWRSRKLMPAV